MIPASILAALGQMGDSRFLRVLLLGIGLSLGLLILLTVVLMQIAGWLLPDTLSLPWIGQIGWVDSVLEWGVVPLMLAASIFLMVPVAGMFTGFFLESVAEAVEDRHYPALPPAPGVPLAVAMADALKFLGVIVLVNLLALIGYLLLGPLGPVLFWAVNGYLLGREYFQMAAMRRVGREGADRLRRRYGTTIWLTGTLMAAPLSVPVVNLAVPVLGAAAFTHLFHRIRAKEARLGRG